MEPLAVTLPVTVTLSPQELATVMKALDEVPHRLARPILDKLYATAVAAHTPPKD